MENFRVNDFKGRGITSFGPSVINPSGSSNQVPEVVEIFGGITFESLPMIRNNTAIGKPYWTFITGKISSFDHCIHYRSCTQCHKKVSEESKLCLKCGSNSVGFALKATVYLIEDSGDYCHTITLFGRQIEYLVFERLGDTVDQSTIDRIHSILLTLQGKRIGLRVKSERIVRILENGDEVNALFLTAQDPLFFQK